MAVYDDILYVLKGKWFVQCPIYSHLLDPFCCSNDGLACHLSAIVIILQLTAQNRKQNYLQHIYCLSELTYLAGEGQAFKVVLVFHFRLRNIRLNGNLYVCVCCFFKKDKFS